MKKIRTLLLYCIIFSIAVTATVAADELEEESEFHHGIGVAAGFVTGYGLSYRYLGEKFNLQFTFAPYVERGNVTISTGAAVLKDLFEGKTSRLFLYSGLHYWYHKYTDEPDEDETEVTAGEQKDQWFICGIGPGFEFNITENIVFDLMAGYAVYLRDNENTMLNFTGELAVFFYFE